MVGKMLKSSTEIGKKPRCVLYWRGFLFSKGVLFSLDFTSSSDPINCSKGNHKVCFGLFNHKLHHPTVLPIASEKATALLLVVNVLLNRIIVKSIVIVCHFSLAFHDGFGFFVLQTYQPFLTTIFPYWYWLGLPEAS